MAINISANELGVLAALEVAEGPKSFRAVESSRAQLFRLPLWAARDNLQSSRAPGEKKNTQRGQSCIQIGGRLFALCLVRPVC